MRFKIPFCIVAGLLLASSNCYVASDEVPASQASSATTLRLARFDVDATPPIGSHLAYDPVTNVWDLSLRARGIVLLGAGQPIVLCSIDWIGIANESNDAFRKALAQGAQTVPDRVAVHTVHQHDAPECDFGAEELKLKAGLDPLNFNSRSQREVLQRLVTSIKQSLTAAQPVTHIGFGKAMVSQVASNRRILGPDGKVRVTRYTSCKDPAVRAEPEGLIDPELSMVSFWSTNKPIAVLTYYAVHPQSYYRTGIANPDFPGVARFFRQLAVPSALHVHFNGAGGNLGAGKYNDGSPENRLILAERLADGMKRAWESTEREPVSGSDVGWTVEPVALPPAKSIEKIRTLLKENDPQALKGVNASRLEWLRRCEAGHRVNVVCLSLGQGRVLFMPGELFVEYQLAAKAERPGKFVAMAAYGDYGTGYIGTAVAYQQGGYEASPEASNVEPEAEGILLKAIKKVLQK
jgi:hypothetical protein